MSGAPSVSAITSSPVKHTVQCSGPYAASRMNAEDMKKQLASELQCHWVGPMPVEAFFDAFLNIDRTEFMEMPRPRDDYFGSLPFNSKEPDLYKPFIKLVSESGVADNLKLLDTSKNEDKDTELTMKNKPDVTAYDIHADVSTDQPTSYSQAEIIFEFKPLNNMVNPFDDLSEKGTQADLGKFLWEPTAEGRSMCRGQLACYARAWMSRQHRTHCFVVWIGGSLARIIRFDRSGAVVTQQFDIRSKSLLLLEFLWRFSHASPEMRGIDTTVSRVTDEQEIRFAKEKLAKWAPNPKTPHDVLKFQIPNGGSPHEPQWRQVLAWAPLANPQCVVGRATRGYPAWDLNDKKLVFMKDSWRVLAEDISKETDILKALNDAEVLNVPKLLYGDDLSQQTTRTQEFVNETWNLGGNDEILSKRVHIRFTTDLIGIHLTKFKSSRDFVQAWFDALLAHQDAYEKCGILHRDISLNNILLKPEGGGFLNDWDMARTLDDIETGPRQPSRSGTWQFMSVRLLGRPDKKHTLQDDLESFFWVLLYVTIRYLTTSLIESRSSIPKVMRAMFDTSLSIDDTKTTGGWHKERAVTQHDYIGEDFHVTNNRPLSDLVSAILEIIESYLLHWLTFNKSVKNIAKENGLTKESATVIYEAKENDLELSSHVAMVTSARTALNQEWPVGDGPSDHCATLVVPSSKRPAADEILNGVPGPGSERTMKRLKLDKQANDRTIENGSSGA